MTPASPRLPRLALAGPLALGAMVAGLLTLQPAVSSPAPGKAVVAASPVRTLADALARAQWGYQLHTSQRLLDAADLADQVVAVPWTLQPIRGTAPPAMAASSPSPGLEPAKLAAQLLPLDPAAWRRDAGTWLTEGDGRVRRHARKSAVRRVGAEAVRWAAASLAPLEAHGYPWSYPRGGAVEVALVSTPGTEATLEICDARGRSLASGTSRADALVLRFSPRAGERVRLRVWAGRAAAYHLLTE